MPASGDRFNKLPPDPGIFITHTDSSQIRPCTQINADISWQLASAGQYDQAVEHFRQEFALSEQDARMARDNAGQLTLDDAMIEALAQS